MKLWLHQQKALEKRKDKFCLFFDTGTGKTRTALEFLNIDSPRKTLIIAPLNVCRNWIDEIKKFSLDSNSLKIFLVAGSQTTVKKKKTLKEFNQCKDKSVLITNTETLGIDNYLNEIIGAGIEFLIIDEAHDFKNPESNRGKGLIKLVNAERVKNIYLLTGTPTPQGKIDLYTPMYLTGYEKAPYYAWKKKHFYDENSIEESNEYFKKLYSWLKSNRYETACTFWDWKKLISNNQNSLKEVWIKLYAANMCNETWVEWRYKIIKKLKAFPKLKPQKHSDEYFEVFLKEYTLTANKNECIDLPPLVKTKMFFELKGEQARIYKDLKENLSALIRTGEEVKTPNLLTNLLRLQQVCAGNYEENNLEHDRLKVLKDAIEKTNGEQFIIWTIFSHTYDEISTLLDSLNIEHGMLTGDTPASTRHEIMQTFQEGNLRAIIAHPKAGGVGVNLTKASYSIHYTKDFNLVNDMQCEARNYRGGSEIHEKITRIDILAQDTVDEKVHEALLHKKSVQDFILNLNKEI